MNREEERYTKLNDEDRGSGDNFVSGDFDSRLSSNSNSSRKVGFAGVGTGGSNLGLDSGHGMSRSIFKNGITGSILKNPQAVGQFQPYQR